jgi:hypothetical protein
MIAMALLIVYEEIKASDLFRLFIMIEIKEKKGSLQTTCNIMYFSA